MGQAAYDYNTARRRKVPQTQRKTALRVEKGGKRRLSPLQAALRNAMHLVAAALNAQKDKVKKKDREVSL